MLAEWLDSGLVCHGCYRSSDCKIVGKVPPVYRPGKMIEHGTAFKIDKKNMWYRGLKILDIDGRNHPKTQAPWVCPC